MDQVLMVRNMPRGGVILIGDYSNTWVAGFCNNIGNDSSFVIELWSFITNLQLNWDIGIKRAWIERNYNVTVDLLIND